MKNAIRNRTLKTADALESFARDKTQAKHRRTIAFKLAQKIRAAHKKSENDPRTRGDRYTKAVVNNWINQ